MDHFKQALNFEFSSVRFLQFAKRIDEKSYLLEIPDDHKVPNKLLRKNEGKKDIFDNDEAYELFKSAIDSVDDRVLLENLTLQDRLHKFTPALKKRHIPHFLPKRPVSS